MAQVAARLPQHTIINAGQNGNTILNLLARLDDLLAQEPDIVFVFCGGNDAISYSQPETRRYYERVMKVPNGGIDPRSIPYPLPRFTDAHPSRANGSLCRLKSDGTQSDSRRSYADCYNQIAAEVCSALNVQTLDLMKALNPNTSPTVHRSRKRPLTSSGSVSAVAGRITKPNGSRAATLIHLMACI